MVESGTGRSLLAEKTGHFNSNLNSLVHENAKLQSSGLRTSVTEWYAKKWNFKMFSLFFKRCNA